jgi:HPt (histidine-containing phosphotransfer) domain-containing protein
MASEDRESVGSSPGFLGQSPDPSELTYPIDLIFLAHQTLGDEQLEEELLLLFERQAGEILAALAKAEAATEHVDLAHRLKGSARAVGAAAVALAAENYESAAQKNTALSSHFGTLATAVGEARAAIRRIMPGAAA